MARNDDAMGTSTSITINEDKIRELSLDLSSGRLPDQKEPLPDRYPLLFPTINDEIGLMGLIYLLNFGDHYRPHLFQYSRSKEMDTFDIAQRGVLGLYISGKLDASRLVNLSINDIESNFGLTLTRDERLTPESPAYIAKDTPLKPLAQQYLSVLHDTGRVLMNRQCTNIGDLVMSMAVDNRPLSSSYLVQQLSQALPNFNDVGFYRNASLFVRALYTRFHTKNPMFQIKDMQDLPVPVDFQLINLLRARSVIELSGKASSFEGDPDTINRLRSLAARVFSTVFQQLHLEHCLDITNYQLEKAFNQLAQNVKIELKESFETPTSSFF